MVPTIEDVARRAGVSRSTVSYALSGKRSISRETRERIEAAIAELGFTPNAGARALATSQTMVIGLFVQFFEDEFSPAMLQYVLPITEAARAMGYDILMMTEADGAAALTRVARSAMVDGVGRGKCSLLRRQFKACAWVGRLRPASLSSPRDLLCR